MVLAMKNKISTLKTPLKIQLIHALLCILWNVVGITLIYIGERALGPIANWTTVIMSLIMAVSIYIGAKRFHWLYLFITLLQLILASKVVASSFILNPQLWPSDFWRLAGAIVNNIGIIGAVLGLLVFFSKKVWKLQNEDNTAT